MMPALQMRMRTLPACSALQLPFELVQELPVSTLRDDLIGYLSQRLERVVEVLGIAIFDEKARRARGIGGASVRGFENGAERALRRHRIAADELSVAHHHATEVLGPRTIHHAVDHGVTDAPGAELLRVGRQR